MMLKTFVFAVLAVAVLADDYTIPDDKRAQLREMLRAQCQKNNAEDKVDQVEVLTALFFYATGSYQRPVGVAKNISQKMCSVYIEEVTKALTHNAILSKYIKFPNTPSARQAVSQRYCAKTPELKTCIYNLLDGVTPCIDTNARDQMSSFKNGTNQFIDFICYKDGDRIALFIAEGGPQCFTSKVNEVRECANKIKDKFSSIEAAKALSLDQKCATFDELSACIVTKLEGCETPTPSNMAESLFRFVRKGSPCNKDNKE